MKDESFQGNFMTGQPRFWAFIEICLNFRKQAKWDRTDVELRLLMTKTSGRQDRDILVERLIAVQIVRNTTTLNRATR